MKRINLALLIVILTSTLVLAASKWKPSVNEDASIDGTEIVYLENGAGTANNWLALDTIKTWLQNTLTFLTTSSDETITGTWVFDEIISVPGITSTAPDGAHYLDINNGVAITATATAGFLGYLTDRFWIANGANWTTRYLLDSTFIGSAVQAWDTDLDDWADISTTTGSIGTTGTISGAIVTDTDAGAHTLTEAEYHGGSVLATGAGIYTLPTAAAGRHGCVETGQGITAIIQLLPASGDYIVNEGARGTIATAIASDGSAGDRICYRAYNADDWYVSTFGTWAE